MLWVDPLEKEGELLKSDRDRAEIICKAFYLDLGVRDNSFEIFKQKKQDDLFNIMYSYLFS